MKMDFEQKLGGSSIMTSVESNSLSEENLGSQKESPDHHNTFYEKDCNNLVKTETKTNKQDSSSVTESSDQGLFYEELPGVSSAIKIKTEPDESDVNELEKSIETCDLSVGVIEGILEQKTSVLDSNNFPVISTIDVSTNKNPEENLIKISDKSSEESFEVDSNKLKLVVDYQDNCNVEGAGSLVKCSRTLQDTAKKPACTDLDILNEKCTTNLDDNAFSSEEDAKKLISNDIVNSNEECLEKLDETDEVILNEDCAMKLNSDSSVISKNPSENSDCVDSSVTVENNVKKLDCDNTPISNEKYSEKLECIDQSIIATENCSKTPDCSDKEISKEIVVEKLNCNDSSVLEEKCSGKLDSNDNEVSKESCSEKLESNIDIPISNEEYNSNQNKTFIAKSEVSPKNLDEDLSNITGNDDSKLKDTNSDEEEHSKADSYLIVSDDDEDDPISAQCIEMANAEYNENKEKDKDINLESSSKTIVSDSIVKKSNDLDESEDEIDSILPEFVDSEYADQGKGIENVTLSDSEAEMDSVIEAFKAEKSDSEDDCLIIEDDSNEIVLIDDKSDVKELVTESPKIIGGNEGCSEFPKGTDMNVSKETEIKLLPVNANVSSLNNQNISTSHAQNNKELFIESNVDSCKESVNVECKGSTEMKNSEPDNQSNITKTSSSENSNVLDLINQNLESIVSLISESSNVEDKEIETGAITQETKANNSNNLDVRIQICDQNSDKSETVKSSSDTGETVKKLMNELVNTLSEKGSPESSADDAKMESDDLAIELRNKQRLLESSSSERSLESVEISSHSPQNSVELVDSVELMDVVESVETIVKDGLTAQLNIKPVEENSIEIGSGEDKENKQVGETESNSKCLPLNGETFDEPEVVVKNKIEGLFSACNLDYNKFSQKFSASQSDLNQLSDKANANLSKIESDNSKGGNETELSEENKLKDASKKRKADEEDNNSISKKFKDDIVTAEALSKFETKQSWLDKIAQDLCIKVVTDLFSKELQELGDAVIKMENKLIESSKDLEAFKKQATEFYAAQEATFEENNYNPKVPTRTVGVNVKIFRECDIQSLKTVTKVLPSSTVVKPVNLPQIPPGAPKVIPSEKAKLLLSTLPKASPVVSNRPSPTPASSNQISQSTQQLNSVTTPNPKSMGTVNRPRATIPPPTTTSSRFVSPPNVTVIRGNIPAALSAISQNKTGNQFIDLTDDTVSGNRRVTASATNVVPAGAAVNKVNLPPGTTHSNVLLPLNNFVQLIPSSQNTSTTNTGTRQLVPTIPSNLLGQRTVGYIYTPSPGSTNNMGMRVPTLISNQNQRLQTYFVRVTNPSGSAPLSSMVNSSVRQPSLPQATRATPQATRAPLQASRAPLQATRAPLGSSPANLLVYSRASNNARMQRHPAPFPQMPNYPLRSGTKPVPPKPFLKGSRNASGIVLSWNIHHDLKQFAEIKNYQLFAYQETNNVPITAALWKPVGNVKALPLPMACTLTQFVEGHKYHFTIRAVDSSSRYGPFSDPVGIVFTKLNNS